MILQLGARTLEPLCCNSNLAEIKNVLLTNTKEGIHSFCMPDNISVYRPSSDRVIVEFSDGPKPQHIDSAPFFPSGGGFVGGVLVRGNPVMISQPGTSPKVRCSFGSFGIYGRDWVSTIGINPFPDHYIDVEKGFGNSISALVYFNYSTPVRAAFDPDVKFHYHLVNTKGARFATLTFEWWRACGSVNVKTEVESGPQPNLWEVADIDHVALEVEWRQDVKWC